MKKILFLSGTRADYGKLKALIRAVEDAPDLEAYIYVSGMHLLAQYGSTYREIQKDGYRNIHIARELKNTQNMSYDIGDVICNLTIYVEQIQPDMIVVHGDRIDALAGAIVGALHNIRVAHIEGGELSGTIDESIRHTISKLAHLHLVCNSEAKTRLEHMGEQPERIFVIGSPDIDIMMSDTLPSQDEALRHYGITFQDYGILMYHPVTTEISVLSKHIEQVVEATIASGLNYVVIYPNNDLGSEKILAAYKRFQEPEHAGRFRVFPSIRFEYFLTLLKHARFMIGNSSAGVRETCVYGVPSIDIGTRQSGRYNQNLIKNIQHTDEDRAEIEAAIAKVGSCRYSASYYGDGKSVERFIAILRSDIWDTPLQKRFIDIDF